MQQILSGKGLTDDCIRYENKLIKLHFCPRRVCNATLRKRRVLSRDEQVRTHRNKTLSALAYYYGYTDGSHLSNAFKTHFVQSPTAFKKFNAV
jgi:AraC-like DNA-binding protein